MKQAILFADSARGIYIPQHFAETHSADHWVFKYCEPDSLDILRSGPEHGQYWDAWYDILDNAETVDGGILWQDGDLWVVWPQLAIDAVNEYCQFRLEYEESHKCAGEVYAHMVAESWDNQKTRDLIRELDRDSAFNGINQRWLDIDPETLSDMAIECFDMRPGPIFGPCDFGIVLDAFPLQEIEIDLSSFNIDQITMDLIRESCDPYISGTNAAYLTTDSVWYAVLNVKRFNAMIEKGMAQ